jgi:hypothetical protein
MTRRGQKMISTLCLAITGNVNSSTALFPAKWELILDRCRVVWQHQTQIFTAVVVDLFAILSPPSCQLTAASVVLKMKPLPKD